MAYLVSHPDEVKVVSRRFGMGATSSTAIWSWTATRRVQKALDHAAGRHHQ